MNYVLNDEKMFSDVSEGTAIIINSETGIYYGLNSLGTAVYVNIIKGVSVESILNSLKTINGVPSDIEKKLGDFIAKMIDFEILLGTNGEDFVAEIDPQVAQDDNFEILVNEYTDAQELLLADPIHEVKEEIGWTPNKDSIGYSKEETLRREEKAEV